MNHFPIPIPELHKGNHDDVKQLLELSVLYHSLISELADVFDVTLSPAMRAQAFQIVSDFGEEMEKR